MNRIYLDNAATTQLDTRVIEVITDSMGSIYGNPSSMHQFGRSAKSKIERARKNIAKIFNAKASEIVFTAGGSEADNMIIHNAVTNLGVKRIISSKIEHHAVLHTLDAVAKKYKTEILYVDLLENGSIDLNHLETLLTSNDEKALVCLMYINNEIGTILDVKRVGSLCQENNAYFHSDTVQALGHYNVDLTELNIDFAVASAHKFHGPKGVGFAYFKKGCLVEPMLTGGSQERGTRAGTENVHGIIGMEKALELVYETVDEDIAYIKNLKYYFKEQLETHIPGVLFNGNPEDIENSTYCLLNVRFPGENPMLLFTLDIKGIAASGGSACQSGSNKGSHVLNAILSPEEASKTSIRFSFCKHNTREELDAVIEILLEALLRKK